MAVKIQWRYWNGNFWRFTREFFPTVEDLEMWMTEQDLPEMYDIRVTVNGAPYNEWKLAS